MTSDRDQPLEPPSPALVEEIRSRILEWFDLNQRDLPWRQTRDPYRVLVSEVMLQQTQVSRVLPYYEQFLSRFPTLDSLATASTADVIMIWGGLGYNRRAVNLQRAARAVVNEYGGKFPTSVELLQQLPGIGPYTAGAIACFAFEQDVMFMDTNMRRVLGRILAGFSPAPADPTAKQLGRVAKAFVPIGNAWKWNQALIEFGALQCTARKPACIVCPLQKQCEAFPLAQQQARTFAEGKPERFEETDRYFRGRVVDVLRGHSEHDPGLSLGELGQKIRPDYSDENQAWLETLVAGLKRDGLVQISEERATYDTKPAVRVTLPGVPEAQDLPSS